jgi:hypothetical protein
MVIGQALSGIWKFITNKDNYRTKLFNNLPLLLSAASIGIAALPGAIVAGIIAGGSAFLAGLGSVMSLLFSTIFLPALIAVGSIILAFFLLFQVFNITKEIDSGLGQTIANLVCNLAGSTPDPSAPPTVSAAKCIYDFLQDAGINPLTASNAQGSAWTKFVTALGNSAAASIIQESATGQGVFQCVGYIAGVGAMAGKPFNPTNACLYVNNPPDGYSWTTQPTLGCFFVIGSSTCDKC